MVWGSKTRTAEWEGDEQLMSELRTKTVSLDCKIKKTFKCD